MSPPLPQNGGRACSRTARPGPGRGARGRTGLRTGCAALLSILALPAGSETGTGEAPRVAAISVSVRAARARCFTDTVDLTGSVAPREPIDVAPEREGLKVGQILVVPLETVTAGQPLARLVPLDGPDAAATMLRAPVSGTVLRSQGAVGQPVSPRQGPMFQLIARGEIDLVAQAPLAELGRIKVGQPVTVRPLGGAELTGRIRLIDPGTDAATQVGRVRIGLGAGSDVRVGTFARGIVTIDRRCGLGVPYSAVQYRPDGTIVQVVDGGRVETRQIAVGLVSGTDAEVRSGLSESDLVVVRAGPFLREGDPVEPIVLR